MDVLDETLARKASTRNIEREVGLRNRDGETEYGHGTGPGGFTAENGYLSSNREIPVDLLPYLDRPDKILRSLNGSYADRRSNSRALKEDEVVHVKTLPRATFHFKVFTIYNTDCFHAEICKSTSNTFE